MCGNGYGVGDERVAYRDARRLCSSTSPSPASLFPAGCWGSGVEPLPYVGTMCSWLWTLFKTLLDCEAKLKYNKESLKPGYVQ